MMADGLKCCMCWQQAREPARSEPKRVCQDCAKTCGYCLRRPATLFNAEGLPVCEAGGACEARLRAWQERAMDRALAGGAVRQEPL